MTFSLIMAIALCVSCSTETTTDISNPNTEVAPSFDVPSSQNDTEIIIEFSSGTLKGIHVFKPEKSNPMSQINVGFSDNISNLNASGLISEDGKHRLAFGRPFSGEAAVGSQKANKNSDGCGFFIINPLDEQVGYQRIDGSYKNCSNTRITAVGDWEETTVYNRRGVVAQFKDNAEIEVRLEDGSTATEFVDIDVTIKARESRLK